MALLIWGSWFGFGCLRNKISHAGFGCRNSGASDLGFEGLRLGFSLGLVQLAAPQILNPRVGPNSRGSFLVVVPSGGPKLRSTRVVLLRAQAYLRKGKMQWIIDSHVK